MGTQTIQLPDVGADQVDVIEIPIAVGDTIEPEQTLVVVESDKATVDVPSPQGGVVSKILVSVGDTINQSAPIIELEDAAGAAAPDSSQAVSAPAASALTEAPVAAEPTPVASDSAAQPAPNAAPATAELVTMTVPDLGVDGGAECIEIGVQVGDTIAVDDTVITLESDKATLDIPATHDGEVVAIHAAVGQTLKQGDPVLDVRSVGASAPQADASTNPSSAAAPAPAPASAPASATPPAVVEPAASTNAAPSVEQAIDQDQSQIYAGPSVRRLARKLGLTLTGVQGSGPKGRVLKDDVLAFAKRQLEATPAPSSSGKAASVTDFAGSTEAAIAAFGPVTVQPLTKIQHVSAKNLSMSWQTIPHVTQFDEADVTELEAYRKEVGPGLKEQGIRLTMLAFAIKAVGQALKSFPRVNSALQEGWKGLILRDYCHIAFAVDTPDGLVVPVVRDVWHKSVTELAQEIVGMSVKAREKKLTPKDFQGASFTISSLGGIGGTAFTPIVNPPQVAILGLSRSQMKPVWNGKDFQPRLMLPMSFSYDHRVIDGADAARFTVELARLLGDIRHLVL